jgi:hypothetical protein
MDGDWSLLVCGTCMFEFWYQRLFICTREELGHTAWMSAPL